METGKSKLRLKISRLVGRRAVLVDDIIASGRTMIEAVRLLAAQGWPPPACIAVHGLFPDHSDELLSRVTALVVTTNSVRLKRSDIDIAPLLGEAIVALAGVQPPIARTPPGQQGARNTDSATRASARLPLHLLHGGAARHRHHAEDHLSLFRGEQVGGFADCAYECESRV